ncbi:MAG: hypothetical protein HRU70_00950 [Phycisphaeraceae bacterium]|nr:MAG: hypothetical protein HRU70_00950 [Phycisphaeraceae bacterium]
MHDTPASCPRCDYDLRGQADAWTTECPLRGTCPECGLEYTWREVLRPLNEPAPWSFEHAPPGSGLWRRAACFLKTFLRSFRPQHLWRGVPMASRINYPRVAAYGGLSILSAWALCSAAAALLVVTHVQLMHIEHARRVAAQKAAPPAPSAHFAYLRRHSLLPPPRSAEVLARNWRSWVFPFISTRPTTFFIEPGILLSSFSTIALLLMCPAFALLPITLHRGRIRPRHLIRAGTYNAWLIVPVACIPGLFDAAQDLARQRGHDASSLAIMRGNAFTGNSWPEVAGFILLRAPLFWLVIVLAVMSVAWAATARHYLRIPRPWLVAPALAVVALLSTAAAAFFFPPTRRETIEVLLLVTRAVGF